MSLSKNKVKLSTKQQIINESNLLFLTKGFEQTTFADIAKAVGISQPSIYAHFANKMDLLKGVCVVAAENGRKYIDNCIQPNDRAKNRLKAYLEANLDFFYYQHEQAHSILALFYFAASSTDIKQVYLEIQNQTVARIENILIQCKYENTYKIKNTLETASVIHSVLVGDCYKAVYASSQTELDKVKKQHTHTIRQLLGE